LNTQPVARFQFASKLLKLETNRELSLSWAAVHAEDFAEVRSANRGSTAGAAVDVVIVTVEKVVELSAKRQQILPIGAQGEMLQQAGILVPGQCNAEIAGDGGSTPGDGFVATLYGI
jgi:hypothetical protein